jgi:catechol 2,3-dioxygenase-like lactoylglutathione lyase family enzyme
MSAGPIAFESVTPIFVVDDLPQALEFYRAVLGFDLGWSWGEPPHIASVCRDRVEVNLAQRSANTTHGPSHAYFQIDAIGDY